MKISDYAVDHPVPLTIIVAILVVAGVLALGSLTQSLFPDFTKPTINVAVTYPGVAPEEVESQVTTILEDELAKLADVQKISSRSLPSRASLTIEFDWSVDIDAKLVDVRERLNAIQARLPEGVSGVPVIRKMNPSQLPVLTIGVEGGNDRAAAARYVEDRVIPLIATIPGVSSVDLVGGPERALQVALDVPRLASRSATPLEAAQALASSNVIVPAGDALYGSTKVNITSEAAFTSPSQAGNVVLGVRGGIPVRIAEVARVEVAEEAPERYVIVNGERALLVDVMAQTGSDTVKIIKEIKKRLSGLEGSGEASLHYAYYRDQSTSIEESIRAVRDSALLGGGLAVLVLYFFLGSLGPTLIIALSIPFTILIVFIALYLNGQTLNTMTLGGLTVAIGMIVDASIVMLENIWRRAEGGETATVAAKRGAGEMGGAVFASVLTSVVVFVPLAFVTGITGIVLRDVALTIIYALLGSVIAALLIVPFLSALILRSSRRGNVAPDKLRRGPRGAPLGAVQRGLDGLTAWYGGLLDKALDNSVFLIAAALAVLLLSASLMELVGFQFLPDADNREIIVELDLPEGAAVERSRDAALAADRVIAGAAPEAERRVFYVGQSGAWSASPTVASHIYGFLSLTAKGRSSFELIPILRGALESNIPDLKVDVRNGGNSEKTAAAMGGAGFRIAVSGPEIGPVVEAADTLAALLRQDPEVESAELSVASDVLRLSNRIDLEAAGALGVSASDAAQTGRIVFNGVEAGDFDEGGDRIPVRIRADFGPVLRDDLFYSIPVRSRGGKIVSLAAFSRLERERGLSEIPRENRQPTVQVVAQLAGGDFRGVQERLTAKLAELDFPAGVQWKLAGSASETTASFRSLVFALLIGVFLVYAVMAIQFERYRQPLIVLSAIPFTFIGVTLGLILFGSSLSIVAFLGIISLAGVAVNNAIIMIDYTNLLRSRDGLPLREAIIRGASSRVRPILMTTVTTLLGVLPLAFSTGGGALSAVLGQVILGGLSTSTLITFFITPSLYWLTERRAEARAARRAPDADGAQEADR